MKTIKVFEKVDGKASVKVTVGDCELEPGKYAIEFMGKDGPQCCHAMGLPKLTKQEIQEFARKLTEAARRLR